MVADDAGRSSTPIPPPRDVARPVSNLGNTCYMNAVLQALAHAPELCLAMDCEPHHVHCPIAQENRKKRRAASPSSSPDDMSPSSGNTENDFRRKPATRKLRRSSRKSPTNGMSANHNILSNNDSAGAAAAAAAAVAGAADGQLPATLTTTTTSVGVGGGEDDQEYCALCEMEWHLQEVHSQYSKDRPVAPSCFVHGFIDHVAPHFKLGQQEDSHEFLRLFIDAMQKSCTKARLDDEPSNEDIKEEPQPQKKDMKEEKEKSSDSRDTEYPFQLFRGTVESCVTCDSCRASSSTLDPIEDVGLEVTPTPAALGVVSTTEALADVNSAFRRFARVEALDAGYKCENCGKVGRATKQSRLASIPPILTLHLKRFRYGADARNAVPATAPNRRAKSGSAKIEGHIKFEQFFDLKPYLTDELQKNKKNMFCRLFAVVVHAGKNSHSGHYIAYVRNIVKNEWWKMDDARVTMASLEEVMQAEAYMLFYRVVDHPVAVHLKNRAKEMQAEQEKLEAQARAEEEKAKAVAAAETEEKENVPIAEEKAVEAPAGAPAAAAAAVKQEEKSKDVSIKPTRSPYNMRKRGLPDYTDGKGWARAKTRLKPSQYSSLRSAEEYINENVQFKPDFFKIINEEGSKPNAKVDQCPIKYISGEEVVGGFGKYSLGLKKAVHRIAMRYDRENGGESFFAAHTFGEPSMNNPEVGKANLMGKFVAVAVDPVEENLL